MPNTISSRKAGFGYGNKFDFTQTAKKTPAPNAYNVNPDEGGKKGKGASFGLGRDVKIQSHQANHTRKHFHQGQKVARTRSLLHSNLIVSGFVYNEAKDR